ncbi:to reverse transcriptase, partial [Aspergillus sclerotialis]
MPPSQEDLSEEGRDPTGSSSTCPLNAHTPPPTSEDLERLQQEVQRWEDYKAIQQKILQLQRESKALHHKLPSEGYRKSASRSPDHKSEIKIKDIPLFSLEFTLQRRDDWLADLRRTFEGAPWKYRMDNQKILAALAHMTSICRQRWNRHVDEKAVTESRESIETWLYFREWTLSLLRNTATLQPDVMKQMERAHQRFGQDPREFHAYLDTLEQHFPRGTEEERVLRYFAKLQSELQKYIQEHRIALPATREEMVTIATHYWNLASYGRKRKSGSWDNHELNSRKKNPQKFKRYDQESSPKQSRTAGNKGAICTYQAYKRKAGKNQRVGIKSPTPALHPQVETATRFTVPIRFKNDIETHADLDSCAEVDIVGYQFAKQHKLQQAKATAPMLEAVNQLDTPSYGVWKVPFSITDSRGTTKYIERSCVAINRDSSLDGSPILLSMTTLRAYHIHLSPYNYQWWFETPSFELVNGYKFMKTCRNYAYVYTITKLPEEIWLPDESDADSNEREVNQDGLPTEFQDFRDVFSSTQAATIPPCRATDHAITLIDGESPPWGPIYPLSQKELATLRQYLDEFIAAGRIRPSKSPAGAPIIFVPKKDGGLRLCVDYRGLNKITVKNRYPLPLISEILDRLSGSKFFTKIDLKDAYYRIRIREEDQWKTAFRTRYGHFEFVVMPMGLTNAPATFQNYINTALYDILDQFCIVYLDDILIFSPDKDSHTDHVRQVLERLRKADLYAKPSKCSFYQNHVEFLGYIVSRDGISMDQRRVNDIIAWEEPQSYHDVQVFLGFCNFYRRFIYNYSRIALPLTNLLRGSKDGKKPGRLKFTLQEKLAFRRLIAAFQAAPLLRHFDPEKHIRLETDASNNGMAGIMSQPDDKGVYHPIAFWSKKFSGAELNYGTPDQELFAIVWSFKQWRHYLEGAQYPIEVFSDHANLQSFMRQPKINGRQARWCLYLTPFEFIIKHRPGKLNPADGPSRKWATRDQVDSDGISAPIRERIAAVKSLQIRDLWAKKTHDNSYYCFQSRTGTRPPDTRMALSSRRAGIKSADWAVWDELSSDQALSRVVVQQACATENIYEDEANEDLKTLIYRLQAEDPETNRRKSDVKQKTKRTKG